MQINPSSSGMVTSNPINPTDEVPVGPQEFPFGSADMLAASKVQPYAATNYKQGVEIQGAGLTPEAAEALKAQGYGTANFEQANIVQTNVVPVTQTVQTVNTSSVEDYPVTNYQKTEVIPEVNYQEVIPEVQTTEVVQTQPVVTPEVKTGSKTIITYKQVPKTVMVPKVVTTYVPQVVGGGVNTQMPIQAPMNNEHYVRNYPIYERRVGPSIFDSTAGYVPNTIGISGVNPTLVAPTVTPGLTYSTPVTTTGLGNLGTNINQIGTGLNNLSTGLGNSNLNNLSTGINNINTGLNNINTGINNVNNLASGINNLTNSNLNPNSTNLGGALNGLDNVRSGVNSAINTTNQAINDTKAGLNDIKNLF